MVKQLLIAVAAVALSILPASARAADPADVKVMTFNIRNSHAKDGNDAWPLRKDLFFSTIERADPDLVGMQEVLPDQAQDSRDRLKAYSYIGVGRDDGKEKGEASPIMFKKDRFEQLSVGTFWLSETPDTIGSKGWDAQLPRIVTYAKLKDKTNGRTLLYFNTHWDHVGNKARVESGKLMRQRVDKIAGADAPVIVTGDFNSSETSPQYKTMLGVETDAVRLFDTYSDKHPGEKTYTFNGFGKTPGKARIDWILRSKHFTTESAAVDRTHDGDRYPSDHFAVTATLRWNP